MYYYGYGELPGDLIEQEETLGPPPSWWQTSQPVFTSGEAYSQQFRGLGDREEEIEVNPVEQLQDLKFKQEMNKKIPKQASRYTEIDPLSPIFRTNKAKFGFGANEPKSNSKLSLSIGGILLLVLAYFIFFKKSS